MKNQIIMIAAGTAVASTIAYILFSKTWLKNKTKDLAANVVADKTGVKKHIVKKMADHIAK
jgi:hypothetical protein